MRVWIGPTRFDSPGGVHPSEYDDVVHFSALASAVVPSERAGAAAGFPPPGVVPSAKMS